MKKIIYFLIDLFLLIAAVFYSVFKFKKVSGIAWEYNDYKKTILLGNGPSLKDDIEKVIEESKESEVYVLNYFAFTNYFLKIKPEYYVLLGENLLLPFYTRAAARPLPAKTAKTPTAPAHATTPHNLQTRAVCTPS